MKKKINFNYIKKYPYLFFLIVSGLCVYLYGGFTILQEKGVDGVPTAEAVLTDGLQEGAEVSADKITKENREQTGNGEPDAAEENAAENNETEAAESGRAETTENDKTDSAEKADQAEPSEKDEGEAGKKTGVTEFVYYDPIEVSSPYYSDPGKYALTTEYPYETVGNDYFSDAAFIGDSRTLGLYDYSGFTGADFFCDNGFCTYLWLKGKEVTWQNENKKVLLDERMDAKQYKKIYVMLGLNDCGYGNVEDFKDRYSQMLDMLHTKQPDAVIYLLGALHLSKEKSDSEDVNNNMDINAHNVAVAELADGETFFYLDVNSLFVDEERNLKAELTFDGAHLYADGYVEWAEFLKRYAVVKP